VTAPGHRAGRDDVVAEVALQLGFARRFALSCGVRREHLDDFVQDVALVALKRIEEGAFLPPDPDMPLREAVRAWLTGIVRLRAIDMARAMAFRAQVFASGPTREHPIDPRVHAVPSPEASFDAKQELQGIARLKMSPTQREVVRLTAEGYSAREIGQRLGIPEDTAATHLKRARKAYERARSKRK
jgi:RNA polymerase sigma factor (sigma-70 family)